MLNLNDKILEILDARELYLALVIAKHINKVNEAWPGMNKLKSMTGWSKNTIINVRDRLIDKSIFSKEDRTDDYGRDKSPKYSLKTPLIQVYNGPVNTRGSKNEPLGSENERGRVQKMNPEGSKNEPEVLTIRSINNIEDSLKGKFSKKDFLGTDEVAMLDSSPEQKAPPVPPRPPTLLEIEIETVKWLKEDFQGKQRWATIRRAIDAKEDELTDPTSTVRAALSVCGDYVYQNPKIIRKKLLGCASVQLSKEKNSNKQKDGSQRKTGKVRSISRISRGSDYASQSWGC